MTGYAANGPILLKHATKVRPSVVILDRNTSLVHGPGVAAGLELRRRFPQTKVIVLTMNDDYEGISDALRCYSLATHAAPELVKAIYEALGGKSYETPRRLLDRLLRDPRLDVARSLTLRQREVLLLLVEGHSMKEAAATLQISTRTVGFHKYRIMSKFDLKSNSDLVRFAIKARLIDAD